MKNNKIDGDNNGIQDENHKSGNHDDNNNDGSMT